MRDKTSLLTVTPGLNLKNVILFSVLLRTVLFIIIEPWNLEFETHELFFHDPQEYHELGKAILNWDFLDNTIRTPGYPAFIALFYWIFGINPPFIYAVQLMMTIYSVYMTYKISLQFFERKIAVLGALLMAIDPHSMLFSFNLISEALFVPVILTMTYFLIKFFQNRKLHHLMIASVFMALSAYIRPVTLYLVPALLPIFWLMLKGDTIDKLKAWGAMAVAFFLLVSPWYIRNYAKFDSWSFCTTGGYNVLYVYAASIEYTDKNEEEMSIICKSLGGKVDSIAGRAKNNPFHLEKIQRDLGLQIIKENPVTLLKNHFVGVFNTFFSISSYRISQLFGVKEDLLRGTTYGETNFSNIKKFIEQKGGFAILVSAILLILFAVEYSSALLGVIISIREKRYVLFVTLIFLMIYLLGLSGLFWFPARFKLPLMPFYLIFSAYGMHTVMKWYIKRKQPDTVRDLK